jgi:YD repeat-containing protein
VRLESPGDGSRVFVDATGHRELFTPTSIGWTAADPQFASLQTTGSAQTVTLTDSGASYVFDASGVLQSLSQSGQTLQFDYTSAGGQTRLSAVRDPGGTYSRFSYDGHGSIIELDDPASHHYYYYDYDSSHRLVSYRDADGSSIAYAYDSANRLTNATESDGTAVALTYDAQGRVVTVDAQADATSAVQHSTYAYSAPGAACASTDAGQTLATAPDNSSITYCWNTAGQVTAVINPNATSDGGIDDDDVPDDFAFADPGAGDCTQTDYCGQDDLPDDSDSLSLLSTTRSVASVKWGISGHPMGHGQLPSRDVRARLRRGLDHSGAR